MSLLSNFEIGRTLGEGNYGVVRIVTRKEDGQIYAMKQVNMKTLSKEEKLSCLNEIRLLSMLSHENIINYHEAFYDEDTNLINIVMEYADEGDLSSKIKNKLISNESFPEVTIWSWIIQILNGLNYLHENKIMHRDLKSANVLINSSGVIKIGDLNVSKLSKIGLQKTCIGTPYYMAPEIWNNGEYDNKCDVWSVGVIAYELCMLKVPFGGDNVIQIANNISRGNYEKINTKYSDELADVVNLLLCPEPKERKNCEELLEMDIIKNKCKELNISITTNGKDNVIPSYDLVKTIKLPKNLRNINEVLPKKGYKNNVKKHREEMMMHDEYETMKKVFKESMFFELEKTIKKSQMIKDKEEVVNDNNQNNDDINSNKLYYYGKNNDNFGEEYIDDNNTNEKNDYYMNNNENLYEADNNSNRDYNNYGFNNNQDICNDNNHDNNSNYNPVNYFNNNNNNIVGKNNYSNNAHNKNHNHFVDKNQIKINNLIEEFEDKYKKNQKEKNAFNNKNQNNQNIILNNNIHKNNNSYHHPIINNRNNNNLENYPYKSDFNIYNNNYNPNNNKIYNMKPNTAKKNNYVSNNINIINIQNSNNPHIQPNNEKPILKKALSNNYHNNNQEHKKMNQDNNNISQCQQRNKSSKNRKPHQIFINDVFKNSVNVNSNKISIKPVIIRDPNIKNNYRNNIHTPKLLIKNERKFSGSGQCKLNDYCIKNYNPQAQNQNINNNCDHPHSNSNKHDEMHNRKIKYKNAKEKIMESEKIKYKDMITFIQLNAPKILRKPPQSGRGNKNNNSAMNTDNFIIQNRDKFIKEQFMIFNKNLNKRRNSNKNKANNNNNKENNNKSNKPIICKIDHSGDKFKIIKDNFKKQSEGINYKNVNFNNVNFANLNNYMNNNNEDSNKKSFPLPSDKKRNEINSGKAPKKIIRKQNK